MFEVVGWFIFQADFAARLNLKYFLIFFRIQPLCQRNTDEPPHPLGRTQTLEPS
jgi:hypothetical protein